MIVVVGLLITTGVRAFVFQPFVVPSGSMENTLQVRDRIIALRVIDYQRGDILVFKDSQRWMRGATDPGLLRQALEFTGIVPGSANAHMVKRVIGLPGDRVACCDEQGRLTVNGFPLDESDYVFADAQGMVAPAEVPFEVIVPADHLFFLGDHRNASGDSRCHLQDVSLSGGPAGAPAFIPTDSVVGVVTLILFPFDRMQTLTTPAAFADVPPPSAPAPEEAQIITVGNGC